MSLNDAVQLSKAEKAPEPSVKRPVCSRRRRGPKEPEDSDSVEAETQELFRRMSSILDQLTPQTFQQLMKQMSELAIKTEERLKGVVNLIHEKAISEPDFSDGYANMCRCLKGLKVPMQDKPGSTVNFRKLLLNRCQVEFEKDKMDNYEIFEKKQKELEGASSEEEKQRLTDELRDARDKAKRRSLGNIKFIGEIFKVRMLKEGIMHDCIVKLLKNHDEESLECVCMLLSTIGKDLDNEKAKPRMNQYFNRMEKIIKERKTTSTTRFILQEVLDLRRNIWVPLLAPIGRSGSTSAKPADSAKHAGKRETTATPPPPHTPTKSVLTEEEMDKKSTGIIREYLHSKNMKEALQRVQEMNSTQLLFVFVRNGLELALERNAITREHMGLLLYWLLQTGTLPTQQYYKGLQEILEVAEDMAIDILHIWLYLAELITPMLLEGGIPMGELFREISKPLVPLGKAGVLLVHILTVLCKGMSRWRAGRMWREAGLQWKDFLPEDVDVDKFVMEQSVEFTLGDESETSESEELSSAEPVE